MFLEDKESELAAYDSIGMQYFYKEDLEKAEGNVYRAMVENMDENIGRLIADLEKNGKRNNTLIWFLSDNGGTASSASNYPLNGKKGIKFEKEMSNSEIGITVQNVYQKHELTEGAEIVSFQVGSSFWIDLERERRAKVAKRINHQNSRRKVHQLKWIMHLSFIVLKSTT